MHFNVYFLIYLCICMGLQHNIYNLCEHEYEWHNVLGKKKKKKKKGHGNENLIKEKVAI